MSSHGHFRLAVATLSRNDKGILKEDDKIFLQGIYRKAGIYLSVPICFYECFFGSNF